MSKKLGNEFEDITTVGDLIDALEHYRRGQLILHHNIAQGFEMQGPIAIRIDRNWDTPALVIGQ